jgi:hypothetical protein
MSGTRHVHNVEELMIKRTTIEATLSGAEVLTLLRSEVNLLDAESILFTFTDSAGSVTVMYEPELTEVTLSVSREEDTNRSRQTTLTEETVLI